MQIKTQQKTRVVCAIDMFSLLIIEYRDYIMLFYMSMFKLMNYAIATSEIPVHIMVIYIVFTSIGMIEHSLHRY